MVVFLDKPTKSNGFEQIVDFLNAHPIKYALMVNPTIYTSCIEQFWTTAKVKTINGEVHIQDLVYKKKLTLIGAKTTAWNEFSSTMASAVICLATNQKFNFSKYIFDNMVKNLEGRVKNLMYLRVKKLEKKRGSRTHRLRILYKVGRFIRVVFSEDEGLGDQKDASKQGRKIDEINQDAKVDMTKKDVSIVDPVTTAGEVVTTANVGVSTAEVTTDSTTTTIVDELTLAQTLIEIKAAKPKVRGVIVQEPNAELEEEEKLARQREEDANIAEWDDVQAMLDANYELGARLQAEEQGELTIEEKSRLFVELMNKRKKHFARLRAEEQRRKPPTKAQKRNTMSTYLKNMAGYKHNQLKTKSFDDIQMLFDKEMKRVNSFVDMDTELVKGSETRTEGSSKRAGEELESENLKKQKLDENVEAKVDNDQEEAEMKKHIEIVPDDEVAIDAIPLVTKPPIIVDWKIIKEGKMGYFQIIRADGSLKMLTRPEEGYERVLWGDLKVMFKPDVECKVWRNLQGHKVTVWKLFSSSGVHFVRFQNLHIFMLVEKRYPLTSTTIIEMLNKKLQANHWNEMCYQLLKLMTKQLKNPGSV
ncbi:hypothetical protein Tco_1561615 [Tanacetum coccineum]